ncbi:MAG TPA: TIGR03621 family F420-dependent LLM class oxidoreductase [Chloroflexota bacterium]|nr:TIGR03621 family F420-dependent LLM class oxidoreductase [Chloroflexota bacterium]
MTDSTSRPHPFRFGVNSVTTSLWEWQEIARKAEAVGFDTLIAQDHFGKQFAPLPALVAAGAVTVRLRLATLVLDNDFRHPAALAKEAATVDVLTSGRLELGLGAGWLPADYAKTGLAFDPPDQRVERLSEAVQICKAFFTAEAETAISFTGKHYRIENLDASPRPTQKPRPPIMIGGRQRRMLSLAAREADIVGISLLDRRLPDQPAPPTFAQKVEWVRQAAGGRFGDLQIHVNASVVDVSDTPSDQYIEQMAERTGQSPGQVLESPGTLVGSVDAIVEQLHARRERYAISYYVIHARFMDAFAPVLARIHGS